MNATNTAIAIDNTAPSNDRYAAMRTLYDLLKNTSNVGMVLEGGNADQQESRFHIGVPDDFIDDLNKMHGQLGLIDIKKDHAASIGNNIANPTFAALEQIGFRRDDRGVITIDTNDEGQLRGLFNALFKVHVTQTAQDSANAFRKATAEMLQRIEGAVGTIQIASNLQSAASQIMDTAASQIGGGASRVKGL